MEQWCSSTTFSTQQINICNALTLKHDSWDIKQKMNNQIKHNNLWIQDKHFWRFESLHFQVMVFSSVSDYMKAEWTWIKATTDTTGLIILKKLDTFVERKLRCKRKVLFSARLVLHIFL